MPRLVRSIFLLAFAAMAAALLSGGSGASAVELPAATQAPAKVLETTVSSASASSASCMTRQDAAASRQVTLDRAGYLYATLTAASGDWDLAIFDATGRQVAAGVEPDAREVASAYVPSGTYVLQACRRAGDASSATLAANFTGFPTDVKPGVTQMVDVKTPTKADKDRLVNLGFDLTEHGHEGSLGVVLHGAQDVQRLERAGFDYTVEVADLAARQRRDAASDRAFAAATTRSALPSGRDKYRTLAEYNDEMRKLAGENPGFVKLLQLPNKTYEGRTVLGLEITTDVNVANGKPAFLNMGVHHAREWPSGEHAMEWAHELVNGFKKGDPRTTKIVRGTRNLIVPIVNPDGFNASRTAGAAGNPTDPGGGRDETVDDTAYLVAGGATGGEYRRKNCRLPDNSEAGNCATSVGLAEPGVDPNRNYGGLWGGPGADPTNPLTQTYRGPGPFSEPETKNVKALVGTNQVTTLITNHTTAGLVLRAPGLAALGDPVDEQRGYKALGDELALHNGYFSQKSFELYDTTGTTEDWTYNTAGGYGFTFEIYCGDPNYETGDCDDPAFHPTFATMVKEWTGESDQANHVDDPGRSETAPFGNVSKFDGKGNREAYYIAAESTLNEARHSIIEGEAPAGATLRIEKKFKTETFPQPQDEGEDKPILFDDSLSSLLQVDSTGKFRWHTNPSTRPIVAKDRGDRNGGKPAEPQQQTGSTAGSSSEPGGDGAVPGGDANAPTTLNYNDHPFTIPATGDNRSANVRVRWATPASDWDVRLYEDLNGDGKSGAGDKEVAVSEQGTTSEEEVGITGNPKLVANKKYVLRVTNFAATEPYEVDITFNGPEPFQPAQVEAYTLTCEVGGKVLQTTQVRVDRGQTTTPDLSECRGRAAAAAATTQAPDATPVPAGAPGAECIPANGFRSTRARGQGRKVAFRFTRAQPRPVTVDVFQQSVGRRVIGERLVARYRNRSRSFTWNGKANRRGRTVTDGFYFVRYRMDLGSRNVDVRRVTLRRSNGRFAVRRSFYRRSGCGLLRSYKLTRPVFGGPNNRELAASFRLARNARVTLEVLRGKRVVRRYATQTRRANITHRLRFDAEDRPRGDFKFRLTVRSGAQTVRSTLVSRRL